MEYLIHWIKRSDPGSRFHWVMFLLKIPLIPKLIPDKTFLWIMSMFGFDGYIVADREKNNEFIAHLFFWKQKKRKCWTAFSFFPDDEYRMQGIATELALRFVEDAHKDTNNAGVWLGNGKNVRINDIWQKFIRDEFGLHFIRQAANKLGWIEFIRQSP